MGIGGGGFSRRTVEALLDQHYQHNQTSVRGFLSGELKPSLTPNEIEEGVKAYLYSFGDNDQTRDWSWGQNKLNKQWHAHFGLPHPVLRRLTDGNPHLIRIKE